jgi:hypothetical protein
MASRTACERTMAEQRESELAGALRRLGAGFYTEGVAVKSYCQISALWPVGVFGSLSESSASHALGPYTLFLRKY